MFSAMCAPDKFRGALTAMDAAAAMARGASDAGWRALQHPIADGGEGTRQVIVASGADVRQISVDSVDSLGRPVRAPFLLDSGGVATIVAADVVGLETLLKNELDPLGATSRGLAAPILAAVAAGARRILIFAGGVATTDGGIGLLAALGATVHDANGEPLVGGGRDLPQVERLDLAPVRDHFRGVELVIATDVDSPLYGIDGAAHVFGPQKGAGADEVLYLDSGLRQLASHLGEAATRPGAGAAGGLGAALMAIGASRVSGAEALLEITRFRERLREVDLVITGEGKVDRGTMAGKAVSAIAKAATAEGVPCVVLGGMVTADAASLYELGVAGVFAIGRKPRPLDVAMKHTAADLAWTTRAICELAQSRTRGAFSPGRFADISAGSVIAAKGGESPLIDGLTTAATELSDTSEAL